MISMSKLSIDVSIIQTHAIFESNEYWKEEETLQSLAFHILEPCLSKSG